MKAVLIIFLMMNINAVAQNKAYTITKDEKHGELVFNGKVTFDDLNKEPSFSWLRSGEEEYSPDPEKIEILKDRLPGYYMVVFLGTWCDDSHNLIPKLEKVLAASRFPNSQLLMYGVDREKTTTNGEERRYKITNVPTIILIKDGQEAGRITESVQKSIEADLAALLQ